jgi:hypothetical protein
VPTDFLEKNNNVSNQFCILIYIFLILKLFIMYLIFLESLHIYTTHFILGKIFEMTRSAHRFSAKNNNVSNQFYILIYTFLILKL